MTRHDGHVVSEATVLRLLRDEGLILPAQYQRERRKLAERRKAVFANDPTAPSQVWQLDFSEFETTAGGTCRLAGCRDYWSKYEHPFHVSPTANQFDAIDAVELALADYEQMFGQPLSERCEIDVETGEIKPVVTIVTDNGGPFRSFRFEAFIAGRPELAHVRTRVKTPGRNGSRERAFGTLKYERLSIDEIDDALMLTKRAEGYRIEYNQIRPHEALSWKRPLHVHLVVDARRVRCCSPFIRSRQTAATMTSGIAALVTSSHGDPLAMTGEEAAKLTEFHSGIKQNATIASRNTT